MSKGLSLGRVLTDDGSAVALTDADVQLMVQAGVKVARVELRLTSLHQTWDSTLLANYRAAIMMLAAAGLRVIGLLDASVVAGATQTQWNANNTENNPGATPTNPFIDAYIAAIDQIASALGDLVDEWEIWNEPNCYSTRSGTVYNGATYIYPSLFASVLIRSYRQLRSLLPFCGVVTGGLFGHNIGGTLSPTNSGATYFDSVCAQLVGRGAGQNRRHPWPFSAVGQHLYLDQGGLTDPGHITTYLDYLSGVLTKYNTAAQVITVTEGAWTTSGVTPDVQATNLTTLYAACASNPAVTDVCWFTLSDNPAANLYYGLVTAPSATPPEAPKPAYTAYQAVP